MSWNFSVISLFPEIFPGPLGISNAGRALSNGLWNLSTLQLRDFAFDKHNNVDDTPFGGGCGMVFKPDVVDSAIEAAKQNHTNADVIYFTPRGKKLEQNWLHHLMGNNKDYILLCGRFEGVDQRVLEKHNVIEVCVGDYILSGGEIAALAFLDSFVRLIPSVTAKQESLQEESFENGLLEYPQYTRPNIWNDLKVPDVLSSGNHKEIEEWRLAQSKMVTQDRRPDLWAKYLENLQET